MMEKRIYNLDNVKVILILLVIIGHTLLNSYGDDGIEYIRFICRCFTMPLFTFISGYLTKKEQAFWKNVKYLLYPCLLFTVVNDILQMLVTPNYVFSWKQPGFAMWYLLALFIYRVLLPYLLRIKYVLLLSFLLSWLVGFIPFIGNDYSLSRIFCFLPYFLLGYFVAHENRFSIIKDVIFTKLNWRGYFGIYSTFSVLGLCYRKISWCYLCYRIYKWIWFEYKRFICENCFTGNDCDNRFLCNENMP